MSNDLAIATVTASLKHLLKSALASLADPRLSVQPLDKARRDDTKNQLNLFLYQTQMNAAWRNRDLPRQTRPNETGRAPLPLNLYYLITAYGKADQDLLAHRILGRAMRILHDHPLLGAAEIQAAIDEAAADMEAPIDLSESDLPNQFESVRFTWHPLSLEEMSKLWGGLQTQFRLSAAYEASVVLIESLLPARTPLPVLRRGSADEGVTAQSSLLPPYPALESALLQMPPGFDPAALPLPDKITSPRPGDTLILMGHHLAGTRVIVRFFHPRQPAPLELDVTTSTERTDESIKVTLDPTLGGAAGFYTAAIQVTRPGETQPRTTNELPVAMAPSIVSIAPPNPVTPDGEQTVILTVKCAPDVLPSQRAALLLGDREIPAAPHTAPVDTLTFVVTEAAPGDYLPRLRIDGVDSLVVDRSVRPPRFDTTHQVTIA